MKKYAYLGIGGLILATILIVFITACCIVFTANLDSDLSFDDKVYNEGVINPDVTINVATYNVKSGYNTKDNLNSIRDNLKAYDVDIVGLQEIDSDDMIRSSKLKCISTLASDIYKEHYFAPTKSLFLGDNYGIMTMANTTLNEADALYLPLPNRFFMMIGEPRVCIRTIVNVDGVDVAFYNCHLSFENGVKMKDGKEMRAAQIEYIHSIMASDPCQYKVLVGDFNILSFDELAVFEEDYNMVNNEDTAYPSYRGDDVDFRSLDNIIYSKNMMLVEATMLDNDLSDHNMLYASLKIS